MAIIIDDNYVYINKVPYQFFTWKSHELVDHFEITCDPSQLRVTEGVTDRLLKSFEHLERLENLNF